MRWLVKPNPVAQPTRVPRRTTFGEIGKNCVKAEVRRDIVLLLPRAPLQFHHRHGSETLLDSAASLRGRETRIHSSGIHVGSKGHREISTPVRASWPYTRQPWTRENQ